MKKIITLLLLIGGFACAASATTVKKRVYVIADDNFQNNKIGVLSIHIWSNSGDLHDWGAEAEKMGMLANSSRVYVYDFDADDSETYTFKVYDCGNTNWQSSNLTMSNDIVHYYNFNSSNSDALVDGGNVTYKAYMYNGTAWSSESLTTTDYVNYTLTIDNQTDYKSALQLLIAPSFALENYGDSDERWNMMYRPNDENQEPGFTNVSDADGGCYNGSSNSVKLNVAAYYELTYKPFTWKFSLAPYISRTLNSAAEGYATFSSAYNVIPGEGLTAKYASAVDANGGITWTDYPQTGIAANQGALLIGTAGSTYKFTPATSASAPTTNFLKPIIDKTQLTQAGENGKTNYILTKVGSGPLAFYKVNANGSWCAAGTAYLSTTAPTPARGYFSLEDEDATAIEGIANENDINLPVYDLQGRRVTSPQKGLYIVNGKKVVIK